MNLGTCQHAEHSKFSVAVLGCINRGVVLFKSAEGTVGILGIKAFSAGLSDWSHGVWRMLSVRLKETQSR
jgi:hypothetical protein